MSSEKEQEVLMIMRKVLAVIIKDTTPAAGMRHPLSDATISDIRNCLGLISVRERELLQATGKEAHKPYFTDEQRNVAPVVSIDSLIRSKEKNDADKP